MGYRMWAETREGERLLVDKYGSDCISPIRGWLSVVDRVTELLYGEPDAVEYYMWHGNPIDIDDIIRCLSTRKEEIKKGLPEKLQGTVAEVADWFTTVRENGGAIVMC